MAKEMEKLQLISQIRNVDPSFQTDTYTEFPWCVIKGDEIKIVSRLRHEAFEFLFKIFKIVESFFHQHLQLELCDNKIGKTCSSLQCL